MKKWLENFGTNLKHNYRLLFNVKDSKGLGYRDALKLLKTKKKGNYNVVCFNDINLVGGLIPFSYILNVSIKDHNKLYSTSDNFSINMYFYTWEQVWSVHCISTHNGYSKLVSIHKLKQPIINFEDELNDL